MNRNIAFRSIIAPLCRAFRGLLPLVALCLFCGWQMAATAAEPGDDYTQNEFPPRPTPKWVRMVDQSHGDPRLKGMRTPAGIRVEVVAQEPVVINPVGMAFADDGTPHVLEWRVGTESHHEAYTVTFQDGTTGTVNRMKKDVFDELKQLVDEDGDGVYERARVLLDDLEIPSSLLLKDGWIYLSSLGHIIRRRQSKPDGPYDIEEEIVRGLCGFHHHQASGMTLSHDGWLFITSGDDDNRGEGSDGSRATVLRCGAIFRCRPDGSQLAEFARGFRNPYRDVAFDHMFNMFHVDNDQEDGSKFQGVRLMHVQEGADYGWRLLPGTVCCRTDFQRGAVFGEAPGRMPSMLKTGRGSPAGLLIYQGTRFPDFFRGLLIYPDVYRRLVRAYRVERDGSTFKVVEQLVLMESDDPLFRPCQAVMGPDGAIYIVDWHTDSGGAGRLWGDGKHGRIYRLTWSGIDQAPAIARGSIDTWARLADLSDDELWKRLDTPDFELRRRVQWTLIRRGGEATRDRFLAIACDASQAPPTRAIALGGACYFYNNDVADRMIALLNDADPDIRRLAADALARNTTRPQVTSKLVDALSHSLDDAHPAARRAAAMALGQVASLLEPGDPLRRRAAQRLFDALRADDRHDVYLHDGILRGLERTGDVGLTLLAEAATSPDADDRAFAVAELQALRTRPAVAALDRALSRSQHLDEQQLIAVIGTYAQIQLEPPVDATAVKRWLLDHADASAALKLAAVRTLAMVGGPSSEDVLPIIVELLNHTDPEVRTGIAQLVGDHELVAVAGALADALADEKRTLAERRVIVAALSKLRQHDLPWAGKSPPGVETVVDRLAQMADDPQQGPLRADLIGVVASVDFKRAVPIAMRLLNDKDPEVVRAAIRALGADRQQAIQLGQRFVEGQIDRQYLPIVAGVLQTHAQKDPNGQIAALLTQVFRGGLLVSLDPDEVARVERLVATTGNPENGRRVFLDTQKSQCAKCHRLEGVGGQVGPDLTKIWETHSVAKILESILDPSKEIKEGYQTFVAATASGQVYSGLKVKDEPGSIVLRDVEGRDITLPRDEIDELSASKKSLMPDGVVAQLSFQEFVDLVAFLKSREAQQRLREMAASAQPSSSTSSASPRQ